MCIAWGLLQGRPMSACFLFGRICKLPTQPLQPTGTNPWAGHVHEILPSRAPISTFWVSWHSWQVWASREPFYKAARCRLGFCLAGFVNFQPDLYRPLAPTPGQAMYMKYYQAVHLHRRSGYRGIAGKDVHRVSPSTRPPDVGLVFVWPDL